ncbi:stage II sporulation protein M [Pseudomonas chlororaphis]|uniref:stage II sporulation protein M n=1 Tax=Pseudomonas chlororaphis TaxID=587753 RepID=UPI003D12C814
MAGHLTQIGYGATFWSFVVGHSAFELSAIALAGAAGLKMGWALIAPGRLPRGEALLLAARTSVQLICGAGARGRSAPSPFSTPPRRPGRWR